MAVGPGSNTVTESATGSGHAISSSVDLRKTADPDVVHLGNESGHTFTVENTGESDLDDVTLTDIKVTDPLVEICNANLDSLDAGASTSYTCQDLGVTESYTNTASLNAQDTEPPIEAEPSFPLRVSPW